MNQQPDTDFDILEMPAEGLAAYWLSIRKLMDCKKWKAVLQEEREHTQEPFIKYLLEVAFSRLSDDRVRRLGNACAQRIVSEYERKLWLMRTAVLSVAKARNPRLAYAKMTSRFAHPAISERQAFELVKGMSEGLDDPATDIPTLVRVDHKLKPERLLIKLLFYITHARREGKNSLAPFLTQPCSSYFREGMAQLLDGFEYGLLEANLRRQERELLAETGRKMEMSLEMALGLQDKLSYEEMFVIARAFME